MGNRFVNDVAEVVRNPGGVKSSSTMVRTVSVGGSTHSEWAIDDPLRFKVEKQVSDITLFN